MLVRTCLLAAVATSLVASSVSSAAPVKKDRRYYEKQGSMVWEVKTDQKLMALTFDDGPDLQETSDILDLLQQYDIKATFFVVGKRVAQYPQITKRIVTEGHEIANHTYRHTFFRLPASAREVKDEIERTEQEIVKATGKHSVLFRPPGGTYDETVVQAAHDMGLFPVLWSWHQDTKDWARPGTRKIINHVLRNARNGDIVLFHDHVEGKSQTIEALKEILPVLKERGFHLITVSELMEAAQLERPSDLKDRLEPKIPFSSPGPS